ncbi:MAG TPA: response regulator [Hyphomicrobiales bacterium]|nr:response regulator [Hyphomicrobiales bacterium]
MLSLNLEKLRFVVADDNAHARKILSTILHVFGAREILHAEDGADALELTRSAKPDIAFIDWMMPTLDGLEITRHIRRDATSPDPDLPIILVTSHTQRGRILAARDAGVTELLRKPMSPQTVMERIASVVLAPRPMVRSDVYTGPDRRARAGGTAEQRRDPARPQAQAS